MNLQLNRVVSCWERSGQGDGDFIAIFAEEEEAEEEEEGAEEEDPVDELGCSKVVLEEHWINENIFKMVRVLIFVTS